MGNSDITLAYLTFLHETENNVEENVGAAAVGAVAGGAVGLVARKRILQAKCKKKYANDPENLKRCIANAQRRRTDSDKGYGFK